MKLGGTTTHQGVCSPFQILRTHCCKIFIFVLLMFLILQYATNLLVYKQHINRMISPGLTWISHSLQQKLGLRDDSTFTYDGQEALKEDPTEFKICTNSSSDCSSNQTIANSGNSSQELSHCPLVPPNLVGPLKVLTEAPPFKEMEKMFTFLSPGGRHMPSECRARFKVAIVIPYRDREAHLRIFLHNLHPILQRQQLDYGIYVIEEVAGGKFNRAMLMNIGFVESLKQYNYDCFIFHDVDLIPEDDRNLYSCPEQPRHMSVAINTMNYHLPYKDIFGGVSALTKKHMRILNGFSNEFWGWGGEDDDMSNRIRYHGLAISRYSPKIARYTMLRHSKDVPNPERYNKLYKGKYRYKKDGLNNLKYKRIKLEFRPLYTWVLVDLSPKS